MIYMSDACFAVGRGVVEVYRGVILDAEPFLTKIVAPRPIGQLMFTHHFSSYPSTASTLLATQIINMSGSTAYDFSI
jgi:hypothetical protein